MCSNFEVLFPIVKFCSQFLKFCFFIIALFAKAAALKFWTKVKLCFPGAGGGRLPPRRPPLRSCLFSITVLQRFNCLFIDACASYSPGQYRSHQYGGTAAGAAAAAQYSAYSAHQYWGGVAGRGSWTDYGGVGVGVLAGERKGRKARIINSFPPIFLSLFIPI